MTTLDRATVYASMKIGTLEELRRFLGQHGAEGIAAINEYGSIDGLLDWAHRQTAEENAGRREVVEYLLDNGLTQLGKLGGVLVWTNELYEEEEGLRRYLALLPRFTVEQQAAVIQRIGLVLQRPHVTAYFTANPPPQAVCRRALFNELQIKNHDVLMRNLPYSCPTDYLLPHAQPLAGPDLDEPLGNEGLRLLVRAALWRPKVAMALLDAGADPKLGLRSDWEYRLPGSLESRKTELEFEAGDDVLVIVRKVRAALFALRKDYVKRGWPEPAVNARLAEFDALLVKLGDAPPPVKASKKAAKSKATPAMAWFRELAGLAGLPAEKTESALAATRAKGASEWKSFCALVEGCSELEPFLEERGETLRMLTEGGTGSADEVEEHLNDECRAQLESSELIAVEDADVWVLSGDVVTRLHPSGASKVGSVPELIRWAVDAGT